MTFLRAALILAVATVSMAEERQGAASGYGAPSGGYGAPTGPTGGQSYDPQPSYADYDTQAYGGTGQATDGGDDLGAKLGELIPLFIAVFAAIILAQLLAPLLMQLLMLLVGILPMALNIKAPIINALLNPFGLSLCSIAAPASAAAPAIFPAAGRSMDFSSRSLQDAASAFGFEVSQDKIDIASNFVLKGIEAYRSEYLQKLSNFSATLLS